MLFIVHQISKSKNIDKILKYYSAILNNLGKKSSSRIIIACNSSDQINELREIINCQLLMDAVVIAATNELREFSAWKEGLKYIHEKENCRNFELIMSNETFLTNRVIDTAYTKAFERSITIADSIKKPACAGDVDYIDSPAPYMLDSGPAYLSTYLIYFNRYSTAFLNFDIYGDEFKSHFESNINNDTVISKMSNFNDSLYFKFLESRYYSNIIKTRKWHGYQKLSEKNFSSMKLKLMSVVIEHTFSQHLNLQGAVFVDLKWYINRNAVEKITYSLRKLIYSSRWRIKFFINQVNA